MGRCVVRDPLRIPGVVNELLATWEAVPDLSLAQLWALLEARGVALNSLDEEVVDALRAVRLRHPSSVSFSSLVDDATSPPSPVLVEVEGPDRRVTLVPRTVPGHSSGGADEVELWAVVRGQRTMPAGVGRRGPRRGARVMDSGEVSGRVRCAMEGVAGQPVSSQPGLWRVSEVKRCRAGAPLVLVDESGVPHRLGVVKRLTVVGAGEQNLTGTRREELEGRVFVARLAEGAGTVVIGSIVECYLAERRELRRSTLRWSQLVAAGEGEDLRVRGLDGQVHALGRVDALLRAE